MNTQFAAYTRSEALVDTDWLSANLENPAIRIAKSNEDLLLYDVVHIPGHTWFVLKYLLGYNQVRTYNGSRTDWDCMLRTPIETGGWSRQEWAMSQNGQSLCLLAFLPLP